MSAFFVDFEPVGRRGQAREGQSLLEFARELGVGIASVCGGQGTCGKCKVQIRSGTASPPTSRDKRFFTEEQLAAGWRLACQTYPTGDLKVTVPAESMTAPQRTQLEGLEIPVAPQPAVKAYRIKLRAPTLHDTQGDADRLIKALWQQHRVRCRRIDFALLRHLPPRLRELEWECRAVVRGDEVVAVLPADGRLLGLAVDVGTTKLAGYLVDLTTGETLAARGMMNPQISYGEDVISRANLAIATPDGSAQLQKLAAGAITELAVGLTKSVGAAAEDIAEAVVVGNTAIHHLVLGLPVRQLALAPFVPAVSRSVDIKARDLGIGIAPGTYVHVLPNIAGFVGADHVAFLLASNIQDGDRTIVALDIGTNTEVSLIHRGRISSVSCASGPAFEGGQIKDGMRAGDGAIERVTISLDGVQYETINDAPAVGICGSGIIDVVAQLYLSGVADSGGRMREGHARVRTAGERREFVLVSEAERGGKPAIVFTQHDVRELQLGKAAIRAGIQTLLRSAGLTDEDITDVIVAGAFGSYLDISSAVTIGMLPAVPLERFHQVGNAAGMGAKRALISTAQRDEARRLARKARYIELATTPGFNQDFLQAIHLGRYRIKNGRREELD